jgi:Tfp pilus assembly protein PilO
MDAYEMYLSNQLESKTNQLRYENDSLKSMCDSKNSEANALKSKTDDIMKLDIQVRLLKDMLNTYQGVMNIK